VLKLFKKNTMLVLKFYIFEKNTMLALNIDIFFVLKQL